MSFFDVVFEGAAAQLLQLNGDDNAINYYSSANDEAPSSAGVLAMKRQDQKRKVVSETGEVKEEAIEWVFHSADIPDVNINGIVLDNSTGLRWKVLTVESHDDVLTRITCTRFKKQQMTVPNMRRTF